MYVLLRSPNMNVMHETNTVQETEAASTDSK